MKNTSDTAPDIITGLWPSLLTQIARCDSIDELILGGAQVLSTKRGSLESFKLFYEEMKPSKNQISRIRRARPLALAK